MGYVYITRNGDGKGKCGIQMDPVYPIAWFNVYNCLIVKILILRTILTLSCFKLLSIKDIKINE